jgi:hypothetical protein
MKRNDIYTLLTEAINVSNTQVWMLSQEQLEQFAALVAARERTRCIDIAEEWDAPIVAFEIKKLGVSND